MSATWGNVPGWVALLVVVIRGAIDFFSWQGRRKRGIEARKLSESDIKLLRAASKGKGLITTDSDNNRGSVVVIKGPVGEDLVYENDTRTAVQTRHVDAVKRMCQLGFIKHVDTHQYPEGHVVERLELTDKAYQILKEAPEPKDETVPEFGD